MGSERARTGRLRAAALAATLACLLLGTRLPAQGLRPLDASHPISTFIEPPGRAPGSDEHDRELAEWALAAWSRESQGRLRFVSTADEASARLRVRWVSAQEGLFGEMQSIDVAGERGAIVHVMPNVSALGARLARQAASDPVLRDAVVYLTCLHEIGHAIGLPHTASEADIMYSFGYGGDIVEYFMRYRRRLSSRSDIASLAGTSPDDRRALRTLYP